MTHPHRDSGGAGHYGPIPLQFSSRSHSKYQSTKADYVSDFDKLLKRWRFETLTESSIDVAVSHRSFNEIVKMGRLVIPNIISEIRARPDLLCVALLLITGENPVQERDRGNMSAMASSWIDWYEQRQ